MDPKTGAQGACSSTCPVGLANLLLLHTIGCQPQDRQGRCFCNVEKEGTQARQPELCAASVWFCWYVYP